MSSEPFAVKLEHIPSAMGAVVWESMVYPGYPDDERPNYRVARLTVRDRGFQYAVFGDFNIESARHLTTVLPPASKKLHGLKVTAGVCAFRRHSLPEVASGLLTKNFTFRWTTLAIAKCRSAISTSHKISGVGSRFRVALPSSGTTRRGRSTASAT